MFGVSWPPCKQPQCSHATRPGLKKTVNAYFFSFLIIFLFAFSVFFRGKFSVTVTIFFCLFPSSRGRAGEVWNFPCFDEGYFCENWAYYFEHDAGGCDRRNQGCPHGQGVG